MKRYRVMKAIGTGGMGTVYRAFDRLTGGVVALKRVERVRDAGLTLEPDTFFLERLAHEFSVLAGLRHPNIVAVLDYGFEEGYPYFTMQLLQDAQTIVQAGRAASFRKRIEFLIQLLQALAYLHHRGIFHRDLKPANILVTGNTVHILDFGLAALSDAVGELAGTTAYTAPEVLQGSSYGPAADLYAVGVLATEMFAGHRPFLPGDILAMFNQSPDLTGLEDEDLRLVIAQLLYSKPEARFSSAEAVITALAKISEVVVIDPPAIRESYLQAAPFVGRQAELVQLTEALTAALHGQGKSLLIGGESGVGKSRLLNELRIRALTAGANVYHGQAVQSGGMPYHLWREPLAHLAINSDLTAFTELEVSIIKEALPAIERLTGRTVPPAPTLDARAGLQRLAYTILSLIRRLKQPAVLVLEDLHWADESLSILETISRAASRLPLLVIGSYRSDDSPHLPAQLPSMTPLHLERFSSQETQQLCRAMIGTAAENPSLVKRLQQESDGNVFFLIEILRVLAERTGQLAKVDTATLPPTLFPAGIVQFIQRRLGFLPGWTQPLLKLAAVAGRQVSPALLAQAADTPIDIDDWLYACAAVAVLEVRDNQWRFAHDKLREALLHTLSEDELASFHRRLALTIESLYPDDATQAKRLAEHWHGAGDIDRTLHYATLAGRHLQRVGAWVDLRMLAERALSVLRPTDGDQVRARLWEYLGDACRYSDVETARVAYQTVLDLYERNDWESAMTSALRGLAVIYRDQGNVEEAERMVDRVLAYAKQHPERIALMPALSLKARFFLMRGDYEQAQAHYQECLAAAREADDSIQIAAQLMNLGAVACMRGRFDEGREIFQQAEEVARTIGAIDIEVYCLLNQANLASDQGDYATAEAYFARCTPMIETLGEFSLLAGAYYDRGDLALRQAKLAEAEKWYQKSCELAEQLQNYRELCHGLYGLGKVAYSRCDYLIAQQHIQESQRYANELNLVTDQVSNLNYLTRINLKLGRPQEALQALHEGLRIARKLDTTPKLEILMAALEFMLFEEQPQRAAELFSQVRYHHETQPIHYELLDAYHKRLEIELEPDELSAAIAKGKTLELVTTLDTLLKELALPASDSGDN